MNTVTVIIKVDDRTECDITYRGQYAEKFIKSDSLFLPEQAYCALNDFIFEIDGCRIVDCNRMFLASDIGEQDSKIYVCNDLQEFPFEWEETNHIF